MNILFNCTFLCSVLLCPQVSAEQAKSDNFFGYLSALLEQKTIGDEELKRLIAGTEFGKVVNPIAKDRAKVSSAHSIARMYLERMLGDVDVIEAGAWASQRLTDQEWVKQRRKEIQDETKKAWSLKPYSILSVGEFHTCAIDASKQAVCWGDDQLGQSTPPNEEIVAIAAGGDHNCALTAKGGVVCWGDNSLGEATPPRFSDAALAVAVGRGYSCALKADHEVECWGGNSYRVPDNLGMVESIAAGDGRVCAVKVAGHVACWGMAYDKQDHPPSDLGKVQSVAVGESHICAIKRDGGVACWGNNRYGQCASPVHLTDVQAIAADQTRTCALTASGEVECWGEVTPWRSSSSIACNTRGTRTICRNWSTRHDRARPEDLGKSVSIAMAMRHTCVAQADGSVRCWGNDSLKQSSPPEGLRVWDGYSAPMPQKPSAPSSNYGFWNWIRRLLQ